MAFGDALMAGEGMPGTPPKTPEELQRNVGLWDQFKAQMQDPNFPHRDAPHGVNMLRSPGYGQNFGDVAAGALQTGISTLQGLRTQQTERKDKLTQQERENTRSDSTAKAYVDLSGQQVEASRRTQTREDEALSETRRANKEKERLEAERIAAGTKEAYIRANATGGAGGPRDPTRQPGEIQMISMVSAQLQAQGVPKIEADARAVEMVKGMGRGKTPGDMALTLYSAQRQAYEANPENWGPLTPQQEAEMRQNAIRQAQEFARLSLPPAPGGTPGSYLDQGVPTPGALQPAPKPEVVTKVEALRKRRVPDAVIQRALIEEGEDPALYGFPGPLPQGN